MGASRTVMGWVAALAFAAMSVLPASARVVRGWTLVDLGTLGGPGSYGAAVSNSGLVVGCSDVDAGVAHAFLYRNGVMHDLGAASDSTPGNSCALAVNNDGVAAGRSATGELVTWHDSTITHLGVHGNIGGINDAGVVVGAYGQGASTHAFMYANGNITPLGSDASTATGINAVGEIVGTSNGRAFVYKDGALLDLGTLGGNRSEAKGVNDHGAVVGLSTDAHSQPRSFLYDHAMQALSAPSYSGAVGINNHGKIVGSGEGIHGFLIDGETLVRLDTLPPVASKGWRHLEPTGINDRGWIVGTGTDPDGNLRAFLLIPGTQEISMKLTDLRRDSRLRF